MALLAMGGVVVGAGLLMVFEEGLAPSQTRQQWLALVFEVVSTFGTVGLSTAVTSLLTVGSKLVIIALMFAGRVEPLVLAIYVARPANSLLVRHRREEWSLG